LTIHHLLSDIELTVFLLLEWHQDIVKIREKLPLEIETTPQLARASGIDHPSLSGVKQYMSSYDCKITFVILNKCSFWPFNEVF